MRVLITSVGTATSIGLIKSFRLHAPHAYVVGVDVNPFGLTAGSQLVDKFFQAKYAIDDGFFNDLASIIEEESIDLLIPINDVEIDAVACNRDKLPKSCNCFIPSCETIELCRNKLRATRFVQNLDVPCPEILDIHSTGPRICRDIVSVGSKGIAIVEEGESLSDAMLNSISSGEAFLQRRITGREYTVDVLSDADGNPLYAIPRERIEVKSGVATKVAISNNVEMIESAVRIAQSICLPGFSNIQFILPEESAPEFIEVNPRFGGCSIASLIAAPAMFPSFIEIANGAHRGSHRMNEDVKWGSIVTRYYEEVLYEQRSD